MGRNKINDLRDHLFATLERLNDEDLTPEQVELEVAKAKQISSIGNTIINSAKIEIDFLKATGKFESESELFKSVTTEKSLPELM